MKNKLCAIVLIVLGILVGVLDRNWTFLILMSIPAITLYLSKHDWMILRYGDPRTRR